MSRRRQKRDSGYAKAREAVWERSGGLCEASICFDCSGRCQQVHHIAGRGGSNPHALSNLLGVCGPCHGYIHSHPIEAVEAGFMRSRHTSRFL